MIDDTRFRNPYEAIDPAFDPKPPTNRLKRVVLVLIVVVLVQWLVGFVVADHRSFTVRDQYLGNPASVSVYYGHFPGSVYVPLYGWVEIAMIEMNQGPVQIRIRYKDQQEARTLDQAVVGTESWSVYRTETEVHLDLYLGEVLERFSFAR